MRICRSSIYVKKNICFESSKYIEEREILTVV